MGFAKYHEDDVEIFNERMYYRYSPNLTNGFSLDASSEFQYYCPFCSAGFMQLSGLVNHIIVLHGGSHEFVYLNNHRVTQNETKVNKIYSLRVYSIREVPIEIAIEDGLGNTSYIETEPGRYEYDVLKILDYESFSEIGISNIDNPVIIKQYIDLKEVSIHQIVAGKYSSFLFDGRVSEGVLSVEEYLTYLKMLIYENTETDSAIELLNYLNYEKSRDLTELYYYHSLHSGSAEGLEEYLNGVAPQALLDILAGNYDKASEILKSKDGDKNDRYGCLAMVGFLINDRLQADFIAKKYEPVGFIGILEQVIYYFSNFEKEEHRSLTREMGELSLFSQYPLIRALIELDEAMSNNGSISYDSYQALQRLTPLAAILYCYGIDDESVKETILKNVAEIHTDSKLIKEYACQNDYSWMRRRLAVSDGELYRRAVYERNSELANVLSTRYIDEFGFEDQIQITPLGGHNEIGASCFVVSYKGYNIMLDCGINPRKNDDEAYPMIDYWDRDLDSIIVTHAHIDHCGGVPKAHAMWPETKIITTAPTRVFLKYLYLNMAKINNGIEDSLEIDNISVEKELIFDALDAMLILDYKEWFNLYDDIKVRLHPAGHMIGAAMVELKIAGKTILYTGDYCDYDQAMVEGCDFESLPQNVDYLITEATYLKKNQIDRNQQVRLLKSAIQKGIKSQKAILLPAAAIGRSQELVCIIGEMKLNGEIPENVPLYIAGMAIPASTQLIPFMNKRYSDMVGCFTEFDGINYPEERAIVIASSGAMTKGSASYRIAKFWDNHWIKYNIIANGYLDDDSEADGECMNPHIHVQRLSLSSHVDNQGNLALIEHISPKVISFIHRGSNDITVLRNACENRFSHEIICRELALNTRTKIFDIYEWLMEGAISNG